MKQIFLDTETTSLKPGNITQLAYISQDENGEIEAGNYFFTVEYITREAQEVTGRGVDFYREASGGKTFKDHASELFEKLNGNRIIAHNLSFDEMFISQEFWRNNMIFKPVDRFDTMVYFKDICNIPKQRGFGIKNPKLVELVDFLHIDHNKVEQYAEKLFNIKSNGFHDAMYDTTSMFVVYQMWFERESGGNSWTKTFSMEGGN